MENVWKNYPKAASNEGVPSRTQETGKAPSLKWEHQSTVGQQHKLRGKKGAHPSCSMARSACAPLDRPPQASAWNRLGLFKGLPRQSFRPGGRSRGEGALQLEDTKHATNRAWERGSGCVCRRGGVWISRGVLGVRRAKQTSVRGREVSSGRPNAFVQKVREILSC